MVGVGVRYFKVGGLFPQFVWYGRGGAEGFGRLLRGAVNGRLAY
jgi:hypothetical protein